MFKGLFPPSLRTEIRDSLQLTIPLASAQVAQAATGFIDVMMMGWLGQATLAGGGLAATTFTTLLVLSTGVLVGMSPLLAEAHGANQRSRIQHLAFQGLWLVALIGLPVMVLFSHIDEVMLHLGQSPTLVTLAKPYLEIMVWGVLPALLFSLLKTIVSALGQPRPIMGIVILGTVLNAVGNYCLGLGHGGLPRLGLTGIAWASVLSQWAMVLCLGAYVLWHPQLRRYQLLRRWDALDPVLLREMLWIGVPIAISFGVEIGLFSITTYLMGALGEATLAAHQIVFQTIAIIFMVPLGMSFATTIRVGYWSGQKDLRGIRRTSYTSMGLGGLYMLGMALVLLLFPRAVIGVFLDVQDPANTQVVALAIPMLAIAALSQILDGVQTNAAGALRGLKDTQVPMVLGVLAFWGVGLTCGYGLGFRLGWAGVGLWLGQLLGVATAAVVFVGRLRWRIRQYSG
jgi:multidrug resistance protein, MATE family